MSATFCANCGVCPTAIADMMHITVMHNANLVFMNVILEWSVFPVRGADMVTGATIVLHPTLTRHSRKFASFDINSEGKLQFSYRTSPKPCTAFSATATFIHFHIL
jgi:hypothetical protein